MTSKEASALEQFIKDHDTRFQATAVADSDDAHVLLTEPAGGKPLDPVRSLDEYRSRFIEGQDPGPTIREAWEEWIGSNR